MIKLNIDVSEELQLSSSVINDIYKWGCKYGRPMGQMIVHIHPGTGHQSLMPKSMNCSSSRSMLSVMPIITRSTLHLQQNIIHIFIINEKLIHSSVL